MVTIRRARTIKTVLFCILICLMLGGCGTEHSSSDNESNNTTKKQSQSSNKSDTFLTEYGLAYANDNSDDKRVIAYFEAEKIIVDTKWENSEKALVALKDLKAIANDNNFPQIELDSIDEYIERAEHGTSTNEVRVKYLGSMFADNLVTRMYYENNPYEYPIDINVFDFVTYYENQGYTSERIEHYYEIEYQIQNGEKNEASIFLDFDKNVTGVNLSQSIFPSALENVNTSVFMDQKDDDKNRTYAENLVTYLAYNDLYYYLQNTAMTLVLDENEILEIRNCLSSISVDEYISLYSDAGNTGVCILYLDTDNHIVSASITYGGLKIGTVQHNRFWASNIPIIVKRGEEQSENSDENKDVKYQSTKEFVDSLNNNAESKLYSYYDATQYKDVHIDASSNAEDIYEDYEEEDIYKEYAFRGSFYSDINDPLLVDGSYVEIIKDGDDYIVNIDFIRLTYFFNLDAYFSDGFLYFSGVDNNGEIISGEISLPTDNELMLVFTQNGWGLEGYEYMFYK